MKDEPGDETVIINEAPATPAGTRRHACLVVVAGNGVGEVFGIDRPLTVGRGEDADVRVEDAGMSRRHARVVIDDGSVAVEDLQSTNGTWVNGSRVNGRRLLADGDKLQFGTSTVLRFEYQDETDHAFQRQMFESASRDGLTGALNKRYFLERLDADVAHAKRYHQHLSLLLFDIDHFKQVNDTYGHPAGDRILRGVASVVAPALRREDVFARYGGEEFAVLARSAELPMAIELAQRLRHVVEAASFETDRGPLRVTISVGVASLAQVTERTAAALLAAADEALYRAKAAGRNRVEVRHAN
ncbi:MAG: diguanylate cyclase [Acidobacteria bacterium]|nr:diguanylate cyclase [Acidobacteriota bacterium]